MDLPSYQERIKIMQNMMAVFDLYKVEHAGMQVELALNLLGFLAKQAGVEEEKLHQAIGEYFRLTDIADKAGLTDVQNTTDADSVVIANIDTQTGEFIDYEVVPNKAH